MFRVVKMALVAVLFGASPLTAFAENAKVDDSIAAMSGNIVIEAPWALPHDNNILAAFMTVHNSGETDQIRSASSELVKQVVLAQTRVDGGKKKAAKVSGIEIGGGEALVLNPDGYHLLLVGLKEELSVGETIPVTLNLEKTGEVLVDISIAAIVN